MNDQVPRPTGSASADPRSGPGHAPHPVVADFRLEAALLRYELSQIFIKQICLVTILMLIGMSAMCLIFAVTVAASR